MTTFEILRHEPELVSFRQGETIFSAGDAADCMFAVVDGSVDIVFRDVMIERVSTGGVFGEMELIDKQPRRATAVAASDCQLAAINEKRFLRLVEVTPHFALHMMRVITERLRRANPI
jgi:CRP-like cAMP-binding protein